MQSPDSGFIVGWNAFALLTVILNCFYFPFLVCFPSESGSDWLILVINAIFAVDILLILRTAYYSKGMLITSQRKILKQALRPGLLADFLAVVIGFHIALYEDLHHWRALLFFTLVRVLKINSYLQSIEDRFQFGRTTSGYLKLLKLILTIVMVAHVGGCVFHLIAWTQDDGGTNTWLRLYTEDTTTADRYTLSLYWAFATMITVGYGDVVPSNFAERLYTIVIMVVAGIVFGYSLSTIGTIINQINEQSAYSMYHIHSHLPVLMVYLGRR